jgi:hypothetical protein
MQQTAGDFRTSLVFVALEPPRRSKSDCLANQQQKKFTENSHIYGIGTLVLIGQASGINTFHSAKPGWTRIPTDPSRRSCAW